MCHIYQVDTKHWEGITIYTPYISLLLSYTNSWKINNKPVLNQPSVLQLQQPLNLICSLVSHLLAAETITWEHMGPLETTGNPTLFIKVQQPSIHISQSHQILFPEKVWI